MSPYNIGFVLYPRFEELDFAGPWEVFGAAAMMFAPEWKPFTVAGAKRVTGSHRLTVEADCSFADAPTADLLIVPGGDSRHALEDPALAEYVARAGRAAGRIASVCTGSFILHGAGCSRGGAPPRTGRWRHSWASSLA